eukprot:5776677-Amphidinium_carterae.2
MPQWLQGASRPTLACPHLAPQRLFGLCELVSCGTTINHPRPSVPAAVSFMMAASWPKSRSRCWVCESEDGVKTVRSNKCAFVPAERLNKPISSQLMTFPLKHPRELTAVFA